MNEYELTLVLPEKATPAKKKSVIESIEKVVKTIKGKVSKKDDWGKLELSYPIKDNVSGVFLHFKLELEPDSAKNLEQKVKVEDDIIRYLLVRAEE